MTSIVKFFVFFFCLSIADLKAQTPCSVGFGILTGYCGIYSGKITKISDFNLRCHDIASNMTRLELATNTQFSLYLGYVDSIQNLPRHFLGSLKNAPLFTSIHLRFLNCGILPGTSFPPESCQILDLKGHFSTLSQKKFFRGIYTISDGANNESCTFMMDLQRDITY